MNNTSRFLSLTTSLVLAAGVYLPAVAAPSDTGTTGSTSSTSTSSTSRTVVANSAGTKPVGQNTYVWGQTSNIPAGTRIVTQVQLGGKWSTSQVSTVKQDGTFVIELTYGKHGPSTHTWRVVAQPGNQAAVVSKPFKLTRTAHASVTAATAVTKPVGHDTYGWGNVHGIPAGAHIESQVVVGGKWSRSQISTVKSNGTFVIPLTYGKNQAGTYTFRFVARHNGAETASPQVTLKRVATQTAPATRSGSRGIPDAGNTGVPAGTRLRDSGSIVVTQPGTVIDGLNVNGSIDIQASNVTVRNSRVATNQARYPIRVRPGVSGVLIEHVEVDGKGSDGKGIYFNSGAGTVRYSNIHSSEDGVFITADNVTLEHNYIHHLARNAGAHPDGIQVRGGDNVTIRGNQIVAIHPQTGVGNAAIQIGSLVGDTMDNFLVEGNWMDGGRLTVNGGGRGEVASALYTGNKFGRAHQYGVAGNLDNSVWHASNVYADNGAPARP